jgi:hypothetical protein
MIESNLKELDDVAMNNELRALSDYQKTWFVTELYLTASSQGEISKNIAASILFLGEQIGVSEQHFLKTIKLAYHLHN